MAILTKKANWMAAIAVAIALGLPRVHGASLYMSVVAETFVPDSARYTATPGNAVTYVAVDAGYIESGDPVGGVTPAPAGLVSAAVTQALAAHGYQPAPAGAAPTLLIVYSWGEIRRDSLQPLPTNHLRGNDRARLLLVTRNDDAEKIDASLVNDRYSPIKAGAMSLTTQQREALQLAGDAMHFVVVSAYDAAALQQQQVKPVWQVRMSTRAVGHSMSDAVANLVAYGAPYFGNDEKLRVDLKKDIVPATSLGTPAAPAQAPGGLDPALVQRITASEHDRWSGKFPSD